MSDDDKTSRTSQKLRQTNKNLIISEIRSLNTRVAELLEQFSLLTMEIGNVADDLERQQVGVETVKANFKELKEQFTQVSEVLDSTREKVTILEQKLADLEQGNLKIGTYSMSGDEVQDDD